MRVPSCPMRLQVLLALALCQGSGLLLQTPARAQDASVPREPAAIGERLHGLSPTSADHEVEHLVGDGLKLLLRPWQYWLEPLKDGLYRYRGAGFDAVIQRDGTPQFRDRDGAHLSVVALIDKHGVKRGAAPALALGDPRAWFEKRAGHDPHAYERRLFLEGTRGLREQLHDKAQRKSLAVADRGLEQALQRIVYGPGPAADARRAALLALWDDCADDEVGALARAQIERYVRERCEGRCQFSSEDLTRINASRPVARRFEPYRE